MGLATSLIGAWGANKAANTQADATNNAAQLQASAADKATQEQARQFDLSRQDLAPWREAGTSALNRLNAVSSGDMSGFTSSPDYNFVRSEGQRDLGNSFAARGGAASGNALRALSQYNQGLASGQFNDWWNRQAGLAGVGQNAVNSGNALGANYANAVTGIQTNAANQIGALGVAGANARASGIQNSVNAWNQGNQNTMNVLGYLWGNKWGKG